MSDYPKYVVSADHSQILLKTNETSNGMIVLWTTDLRNAAVNAVCEKLNVALQYGKSLARSEMRSALGLRDWGGEILLDTK